MQIEDFPKEIRSFVRPGASGELIYRCLGCGREFGIEELLYTCPSCKEVLLLYDKNFDRLKKIPGRTWRDIFDYRKMLKIPAFKGIYLFHEFIGPVIPEDSIVYLGEGHTPMIEANEFMRDMAGLRFFFKNDGQNPSASFKDRGMASALSYINYLVKKGSVSDILAICASTGDTSAAAALYASYLKPDVKSAVLLPHKKVTPQQLSQPLGSGADVFEIPGVFDDCMKIVEDLATNYNVALLNSKNAWRVLGQESYSYEIAQDFEYDMESRVVVAPIGNAGNITAIMSGFLKFYETGIIESLPKIVGVQSDHADPVYRYYKKPFDPERKFEPVTVKDSVAQAAMIGNPVSMPRVVHLVKEYNRKAGEEKVFFVQVNEQSIMDCQLLANRNGHIACTHGGESLAGLIEAKKNGYVDESEVAVLDSTAHALKFTGFQEKYFTDTFPEVYEVTPKKEMVNEPRLVRPEGVEKMPAPGKPIFGDDLKLFIDETSLEIAKRLDLKKR